MKLIEKKLIQNYYETHGSFDRITTTETGVLLQDIESVMEECYKILGYKPCSGYTAKQCHDIRIAIKKEDLTFLYDVLGVVNLQEALEKAQGLGIIQEREDSDKSPFRYNHSLERYSSVLARYFRITKDIIQFRTAIPLCYAIDSLKTEPKKLLKNIKTIYEGNQSLVKFCNDGSSPYVYKGVFHVNRNFSDKEEKTVILDALKLATGLSLGINSEIVKSPYKFAMLPFDNTEEYLDLLEKAEVLNTTYAGLFSRIGINVPDYTGIYCALRIIPVIAYEKVFFFTEESTEEAPLAKTELSSFKLLLSNMMAGGAENAVCAV